MKQLLAFLLLVPTIAFGATSGGLFPPYVQGTIPNKTYPLNASSVINAVAAIKCSPELNSTVGNPQWSAIGLSPLGFINASTGLITVTAGTTPMTRVVTVSCTNDTALVATYAFTISVVSGIIATGYFVDCATGSDSASGTIVGTPWRTLGKVNSSVTTTGSDVWIKADTTCDLQTLTVDWGGTSEANRVVIGSYYVSGGVAYQNTPTNYGVSVRPTDYVYGNGARPTIAGSYKDSCRSLAVTPTKCAWYFNATDNTPGPRTPGGGHFDALILVPGASGKYVTIQDLFVRDSAANGIRVLGTGSSMCSGAASCQQFVIIQRTKVQQTANMPIQMTQSSYGIIRQNDVSREGVARGDKQPNANANVRGSGIGITFCQPCNILVEGNDVYDGWNELLGFYGTSFVLSRGNVQADVSRAASNIGQGHDNILEQNMTIGSLNDDPFGTTTVSGGIDRSPSTSAGGYEMSGLVGQPATTDGQTGQRNLWRNNLSAQANWSASCYDHEFFVENGANFPSNRASGYYFGNTCIQNAGSTSAVFHIGVSSPSQLLGYRASQNLVVGAAASSCSKTFPTNALIDYDHNYWAAQPTDPDCRGTGDVYSSNSGLPGTFNFALAGFDNLPPVAAFKPSTSGAGASAGSAMTSNSVIDPGTGWDWVLSQRVWLPVGNTTGAQVPKSEWIKDLTTDYNGNPRTAPYSMGAIEAAP